MLYLDLRRIFAQKGINNPLRYLAGNGFSHHTAHRLLHSEARMVHLKHLEKLCLLLNCNLNDLMAWHPDGNTPVPKTHPIQKLRRGPIPPNISHNLQQLPPEQLEQVRRFIENLNQNPPQE